MSVLLIAEHNNKEVKSFTLNAITAATEIDKDLHVLVIGNKADGVAKSLSEVPNVFAEHTICEYFSACLTIKGAKFSAKKFS